MGLRGADRKNFYNEVRELELLKNADLPVTKAEISDKLEWSIGTIDRKTKVLRADDHMILPTLDGLWYCQKITNRDELQRLIDSIKWGAETTTSVRRLVSDMKTLLEDTPERFKK